MKTKLEPNLKRNKIQNNTMQYLIVHSPYGRFSEQIQRKTMIITLTNNTIDTD